MRRSAERGTGASGGPADAERHPDLVTVVIPVRNGTRTLGRQLQALRAQTYGGTWELLVVDNGSRDGSREVAARFADRLPLTVVDAPNPRGISAARNRGAAAARGDLLLFCDADDVVDPTWMSAMVTAARHSDVVGGRLDPSGLNAPPVRDSRPSPQPPDGLATSQQHLPYATGASLGVWADVLHDLAGFEEGFRHGGDDIDFSWRAQLAGYRLVHAPAAVTRYRYRTALSGMLAQSFRYGIADAMVFRRYRPELRRPRIRRYAGIVRNAPDLWRGPVARRAWLWSTCHQLGRLLGRVQPQTLRMPTLTDLRSRGFAAVSRTRWTPPVPRGERQTLGGSSS